MRLGIKLCFIIIIWISFGWFKLMGTRRLPRRCFHVEILAVYIYYSYGLKSKIFVGSNILNFCVREKTFLEWYDDQEEIEMVNNKYLILIMKP
jgi:hypothetical protein